MKSFVSCTDMLKFDSASSPSLQWMNSLTSGWDTLSWPMWAPSRKLPWVRVAPTCEYSFITATGPQACPCVVLILSLRGRSWEKPNPTPPPHFSIIAASDATSMIDCMSSSGESTKQADRQPAPPAASTPAFTIVGEFGRNFPVIITSKKSSPYRCLSDSVRSAAATEVATRVKTSFGVSTMFPSSSRCAYRSARMASAGADRVVLVCLVIWFLLVSIPLILRISHP